MAEQTWQVALPGHTAEHIGFYLPGAPGHLLVAIRSLALAAAERFIHRSSYSRPSAGSNNCPAILGFTPATNTLLLTGVSRTGWNRITPYTELR